MQLSKVAVENDVLVYLWLSNFIKHFSFILSYYFVFTIMHGMICDSRSSPEVEVYFFA